jgi:hypothetical protein
LVNQDETKEIGTSNIAEVLPIAQSDMVKTFIYGMGMETISGIDNYLAECLNKYGAGLSDLYNFALDRQANDLVPQVKNEFADRLFGRVIEEHSNPLKRVVGNLPIDELGGLAETLVSLESLKERVTRGSESVSGPIDVAVISKTDGFIWIKRKHYFDPALNPRFLRRQAMERLE